MKSENTNRESHRVKELAAEYREKGYSVAIPHNHLEAPKFLHSVRYVPDLIATSKREKLIIEVRSRQTANDLNRLSQVAERVNAQPGWQFVLVFTNPRNRSTPMSFPNLGKAHELLNKSLLMGSETPAHIEASFVFAWAALEAAVRLLPTSKEGTRPISTPWTLVRDAATDGLIARDDAKLLERLLRLRNSLLHAGEEPPPRAGDVELLRRITEELLGSSQQVDAEEVL